MFIWPCNASGVDGGGLFKEFIDTLTSRAFDPRCCGYVGGMVGEWGLWMVSWMCCFAVSVHCILVPPGVPILMYINVVWFVCYEVLQWGIIYHSDSHKCIKFVLYNSELALSVSRCAFLICSSVFDGCQICIVSVNDWRQTYATPQLQVTPFHPLPLTLVVYDTA